MLNVFQNHEESSQLHKLHSESVTPLPRDSQVGMDKFRRVSKEIAEIDEALIANKNYTLVQE